MSPLWDGVALELWDGVALEERVGGKGIALLEVLVALEERACSALPESSVATDDDSAVFMVCTVFSVISARRVSFL